MAIDSKILNYRSDTVPYVGLPLPVVVIFLR